jgi:pilus assembly protein CpaE
MAERKGKREAELTALLIAPDRGLAEQFLATLQETKTFQVLADLRNYPTRQTLDIRLRQLQPDVVLLDVASHSETACELIRFLGCFRPATQVVGLALTNDSELIIRTLRLGATEFLAAPFAAAEQWDATARIRRLRAADPGAERESGKVVVFASAKPGAGASTLAVQTAFALRRRTGQRVLLVDLDLAGGSLAFYLKLHASASVADALERAGFLEPALWASLVAHCEGVEVLAGPDEPAVEVLEPNRLHDLLEFARMVYAFTVLDTPAVPHRSSLLALSESDRGFVVSTPDLASLHLTHRAVRLLDQFGFGKDRFQILINRFGKRDGVGVADIRKMFTHPVEAVLPNDYFALHQAVSLGQPLAADHELGKAVDRIAGAVIEAAREDKNGAGRGGAAAE